jgi:hypothetical protein
MRNKVCAIGVLTTFAIIVAGCSTQQPSTPSVSAPPPATVRDPIQFRVVPERNPAGCTRFDAALSRVHTLTPTTGGASVTSAGGISSNMTETSPGIYSTNFSLGSTTLQVVANASTSPKTLAVTEPRLGCRWSAVAP